MILINQLTTGMENPSIGIAPPGYRLPAETRLGPVRLQVSDLSRSLAFYQGRLGFHLLDRQVGSAMLGAADRRPLLHLREHQGARPVPRQGRLGLYHYAVLLPDRAALARFARHLLAGRVPTGMSDHTVSEALYLRDPDGLGIEVYADRPRGTWPLRGREIAMTSGPLDLDRLLPAGGDRNWAGMPAGTVIGHMHLSVSDLERAAAFYHAGLGFDKVVWGYLGALFFSAGGYHHHLGTNTWSAGALPAGGDDARLLQWSVLLPDAGEADAAARSLGQAGFEVHGETGDWIARDPWGTDVRLLADTNALEAGK
jgi:catechol 2,3-dioxygenase